MKFDKFLMTCPDEETAEALRSRFAEAREKHAALFALVMGYKDEAAPWIILDDCLRMSNRQMADTLEMLEERAG